MIVFLCVMVGASTLSVGGFAPLLPEIGRALHLSDVALGVLAGTFGFARMAADLPAGLFLRRHLRLALILLSGLVAGWSPGLMPGLLALVLLTIGVMTALASRRSRREPGRWTPQ